MIKSLEKANFNKVSRIDTYSSKTNESIPYGKLINLMEVQLTLLNFLEVQKAKSQQKI